MFRTIVLGVAFISCFLQAAQPEYGGYKTLKGLDKVGLQVTIMDIGAEFGSLEKDLEKQAASFLQEHNITPLSVDQARKLPGQAITRTLRELMVDGIKYEKIAGEVWDQRLFDNAELENYLENLHTVRQQKKTLYDYVEVDSNIERTFVKELEEREDIKFYLKLPFWFKIQTPLGEYNPDWAIVFEGDRKIYFVAETKGTMDIDQLSVAEWQKIKCGKRHFENFDGVKFKAPVTKLSQVLT